MLLNTVNTSMRLNMLVNNKYLEMILDAVECNTFCHENFHLYMLIKSVSNWQNSIDALNTTIYKTTYNF